MNQMDSYNIQKLKGKTFWVCLFLFLLTVGLYCPSLRFSFVNFDDPVVLLAHPNLYNEKSFLSSVQEILFYFPREEPLLIRDISWAIDSRLFGFNNPFGYHLGNVLINGFNSALLYLFLFLLTNNKRLSLLVAFTFSVHPIHVEPVCWIMGRKDVLVTFFMLLALNIQTLYLITLNNRWYYLTILLTLMALLSKINATSLFLVLAAHRIYFPYLKGDLTPNATIDYLQVFKKILPAMLPHFLITLFVFIWYQNVLSSYGVFSEGMSVTSIGFKYLICFIPIIILLYFKLFFFPFEYSLHYPFPNIDIELTLGIVGLSVGIGLLLVIGLLWTSFHRKDIFFYCITFLFLMIPYFNIIGVGIWMANRYAYFSLFCICAICIGLGLEYGLRHPKTKYFLFALWGCFITGCIYQTLSYQQVWKNDHSLWTYETRLKQPWILSYIYLANSYIDQSLVERTDAGRLYQLNLADETVEIGMRRFGGQHPEKIPHYYKFYYLKAVIAELKNESKEDQLTYLMKAYQIRPNDPSIIKRIYKLYFQKALTSDNDDQRLKNAEISFSFFKQYLVYIENEPQNHKQNLLTLETYRKHFPFLENEIVQIQTDILKKMKP